MEELLDILIMFGWKTDPDKNRSSVRSTVPSISTIPVVPDESSVVMAVSSDMNDYTEEEIGAMYQTVLDHLLFPPHVQAQLKEQNLEKKWQMIQMQKHILKDSSFSKWGETHQLLLNAIITAKTPDIQLLIRLKSLLSTSDKAFLISFIHAGGINVLMVCAEERLARVPMTELDAALLYEVMCCCKMVMNNATGMIGFINSPHAIERIAQSLLFEWKPVALQVQQAVLHCSRPAKN